MSTSPDSVTAYVNCRGNSEFSGSVYMQTDSRMIHKATAEALMLHLDGLKGFLMAPIMEHGISCRKLNPHIVVSLVY